MPKVQTYVNKKGQTVAQDAYGSWRVYNPTTKKFGAYAKGPETESESPAPPGVDPGVAHLVERLNHTEELEQLKQRVRELEGEVAAKDVMIATRDSSVERLQSENTSLKAEFANEKTARQNAEGRASPATDPAEIDRLKQEIARLTTERNDAVRGKEAAETTLEEERRRTASAPPAYQERFYERWWQERTTPAGRGKLIGATVVALIFLFFLVLGVHAAFFAPSLPTNIAVLQQQIHDLQTERDNAVAAKSAAESDRTAARSAQATAETAQHDAESKLSTAQSERDQARDELAKLKSAQVPEALQCPSGWKEVPGPNCRIPD